MDKKRIRILWAIWYLIAGFIFGMFDTTWQRTKGENKGCVYKSLAPMFNPGYIASCEIFRERFSNDVH